MERNVEHHLSVGGGLRFVGSGTEPFDIAQGDRQTIIYTL